jgi:serine protease Do
MSAVRADDMGANKAALINSVLPAVVNISVKKESQTTPAPTDASMPVVQQESPYKTYVGSGFIIDPSGLVVTNYHVVENAFEITVMLSDGTPLHGKLMSASRLADLALIKIQANQPLVAAHWGNSDQLQVGDQVFAAGNPFGLGLSLSTGIVSALNRDIQNSPYDNLIQTDAPINHGNSGGPLFDMQANVVGVDSTIISPTTGSVGIGFAIPSNSARFVINQLRTYGWVRPGWIGLKVQQVTPDIADAIGMVQPEGSIVSWVLANGPAEKAGLSIGDVILRFGGAKPSDERALLRDIATTPVGETITLVVRHDNVEHNVPVTVEEWPRNQWDARDAPTPVETPKIMVPPNLGLSLASVKPEDKEKLGLVNGMNGVLITGVVPQCDAAHRGVAKGDVILRVADTPVASPSDVQAGIDTARDAKRDFLLMLVLPKVRPMPGPKWFALRIATSGG